MVARLGESTSLAIFSLNTRVEEREIGTMEYQKSVAKLRDLRNKEAWDLKH